MKTLYLECSMGAAGDMLTAALLELHPDREGFLSRLNNIGLPDVSVSAEPSVKCGITGTHMHVLVGGTQEGPGDGHIHSHSSNHSHGRCSHTHAVGHHSHYKMDDITGIISELKIPDSVKKSVLSVYGLIAEAESSVHGVPVQDIHFHEVGAMDAVADITGVCMLIDELAPEKIIASPVNTGSGYVKCSHGTLPVPAPAVARLLKGVPVYSSGNEKGELCTPTGAALLKHFASSFGPMPCMTIESIGYGMGKKDFEAANCLRAMLGQTEDSAESIIELCCNLDDMTPEEAGFALNRLLECGALDVYAVPIQMKKNRPAFMLSCLCRMCDKDRMLRLIFTHTKTLGVREHECRRYVLDRSFSTLYTKYGPVRIKEASGYGVKRQKAEYGDIAEIARENGVSVFDVENEIAGRLYSPHNSQRY